MGAWTRRHGRAESARTVSLAAPQAGCGVVDRRVPQRDGHAERAGGGCLYGPGGTSICDKCSFLQTSIDYRPTLQAQHDDAAAKVQHHRADLVNQLLTGITEGEAT